MNSRILITYFLTVLAFNSYCQSAELAALYSRKVAAYNQGDYDNAIKWGLQAAAKAYQEFGETETYANYAGDLAQLYFQLEKYAEAKELFENVRKIYEARLGPFHAYTAVTNNNLGNIYRLDGKASLALEAYKRSLEGYRQSGSSKEYYMVALNNVIALCQEHGMNSDLEAIYRAERTVAASASKTSTEYVAWTNNLAMLLEETGNIQEAETLYKECIDIVQKNKDTFVDELPTLNANLGHFYLKQNRLDEAEKFMQRSIVPSHESYATHLSNLGMVYQQKKEFTKALDTYLEALSHLVESGQDTTLTYRMVVYNATALYSRAGKYHEEITLLKNALAKSKQPDPRLQNELGIAYERIANYASADSVYDVVVNESNSSGYVSPHEHTRAIAGRAEIWRIQGKLKEAEELLTSALRVVQKDSINNKQSIAVITHNLAYLYKTMGQYPKAEALGRQAISRHLALNGKDQAYANMVKNQGSLYMDMVQYERAEKLIKEAMAIERKEIGENSDPYSTSLNQLGLVYFYQGRYNESKSCIEQSLAIKEVILGKQHEHYANSLVNLANVYMEEGLFERAEPLYRQAAQIYKRTSGTETKNYANVVHALSKTKTSIGFYNEARKLVLEAIAIQETVLGTAHPDYANALNSLGMLYYNMDQYERADSTYAVSLNLRKAAGGDQSYSYAQSLNNIAELYVFTGRHEEAGKMYEQCLAIAATTVGKNHPDYATYLNNIGQAKFKSGRYDEAKSYLERAITLRETIYGQTHLITLESRSNLLVVLDALGRSKEAEKIFSFLNEQYLDFINRKFPYLTEKEKTSFYGTINYHFESFHSFAIRRRLENPAIAGQLYDIQLATKALLLNSSKKIKEVVMTGSDEKLKSLYTEWLAKREYLARSYSLSESEIANRGINIRRLEGQADSLERVLSLSSPLFSKTYQKNVSWKEVRKSLKPGEAAIEASRFFVFDRTWLDSVQYAFLILKPESTAPEVVVLENGKKLEGRFLRYYKTTIRAKIDDTLSWTNYWAPVHRRLTGIRKVYFAPDGVYNEINLNTLTDSTKKSLLDQLSIHVVTSTKEILPTPSRLAASKKTMLIGRPAYRMKTGKADNRGAATASRTARWLQDASFEDLPGTQKEVEDIATIVKRSAPVELYLGERASEAVIRKATDAGILHIATHGFFISEQRDEFEKYAKKEDSFSDPMLRSGIVLAGVENFQDGTADDTDDGILTAMEVCNLQLDQTDLVVMSACETGLGEIRYGEGVYGLQRAFRIAGARAMIMSLWKVDDQATQEMMVLFYGNWLKTSDKRKAFELAQVEIRKKYKYPYYWGAFVLLGE